MDATEVLAKLIPNLNREEHSNLLQVTRPYALAEGEVLIREGHDSDQLFILVSGTLRVTRETEKPPIELGTVEAGRWIGVLSVLDPGPATATVRASSKATLRVLDASTLRELRDREPVLAGKILRQVSVEVAALLRRKGSSVLARVEDHLEMTEPPSGAQSSWWFQGVLDRLLGGGR